MSDPKLIYSEGFEDDPPRMRTVTVWSGAFDPDFVQIGMWEGKIEGKREELIALFKRLIGVLEASRPKVEQEEGWCICGVPGCELGWGHYHKREPQ